MKKFTVRIHSLKRGIRTYYEPQMQKRLLGFITYWAAFFVYASEGTYTNIGHNVGSKRNAEINIENLKYVFGEDNVTVVEDCDVPPLRTIRKNKDDENNTHMS
ncbi:MAG: hypothetical protein WC341_16845 [Bacteroidales bacterium]|jgi:hypothetical protein